MKIIFLLLFLGVNSVHAQTYEAKYEARLKTGNGQLWSGPTTLVFDNISAAFTTDAWPTESALFDVDANNMVWIDPDSEGMKIYTNFNLGVQKYKVSYGSPKPWNFIFTDSIPKINWSMSEGHRTIAGVDALKAVGSFGGRTYTAWFAPTIPSAFGPYRFTGLPGLIVGIESDDGLISYTLSSFNEVSGNDQRILPPVDGKEATLREYEKYVIANLLRAESNSTETTKVTLTNPASDYDIIKDRWTIISDYKRKRGY
ncbi:GLPGLI family protein [Neolewinella antarctica]|uniref:GLPGLI family protein n=1 Tax=Neolewinella antarctica TaxID=442734 RepID=A0ABX0XFC9_9BACT|nr:GLPGLI family protein [Neolewinella antarctica]NJC28031.1 GLPGLI family protein [Neolewinella antarctica]